MFLLKTDKIINNIYYGTICGKINLKVHSSVFMKNGCDSFYELKYCMTLYICAVEEIASVNIEYWGEFY